MNPDTSDPAGAAQETPAAPNPVRNPGVENKKEQELIALYMAMTGEDERAARSVCAHLESERDRTKDN